MARRNLRERTDHLYNSFLQSIPAFYINLDASNDHRSYISAHLINRNLVARRVRGLTAVDVEKQVILIYFQSEKFHTAPNDEEIAHIASHLIAIYRAVHDKKSIDSPYALILEDDVHLEFDIDFAELIKHAPKDFAVLQLMTSFVPQAKRLYAEYVFEVTATTDNESDFVSADNSRVFKSTNSGANGAKQPDHSQSDRSVALWSRRRNNSRSTSTQAYLIHKERVRAFIDRTVRAVDGEPYVTLTWPSQMLSQCQSPPCTFPHRLAADTYLYAALGRTYTSKFPLFNGGHGDNFEATAHLGDTIVRSPQLKPFLQIGEIIRDIHKRAAHSDSSFLPFFIRTFPPACVSYWCRLTGYYVPSIPAASVMAATGAP